MDLNILFMLFWFSKFVKLDSIEKILYWDFVFKMVHYILFATKLCIVVLWECFAFRIFDIFIRFCRKPNEWDLIKNLEVNGMYDRL